MRYVSSRESSLAGNRPNHPAIAASSCPGRIHRTSIVLSLPMTEGPGGPGGGPIRGCSDTFDRFETTGPDRQLDQRRALHVA